MEEGALSVLVNVVTSSIHRYSGRSLIQPFSDYPNFLHFFLINAHYVRSASEAQKANSVMSVSISMMRERVCVCMEVVLMADKFSRIEISTFGNVMEAKVQLFI